jgi:hypothetical protein
LTCKWGVLWKGVSCKIPGLPCRPTIPPSVGLHTGYEKFLKILWVNWVLKRLRKFEFNPMCPNVPLSYFFTCLVPDKEMEIFLLWLPFYNKWLLTCSSWFINIFIHRHIRVVGTLPNILTSYLSRYTQHQDIYDNFCVVAWCNIIPVHIIIQTHNVKREFPSV